MAESLNNSQLSESHILQDASQLKKSDAEFLLQLEKELQQTQRMASELDAEVSGIDPGIARAQHVIENVDNVLSVLDQSADDISFAVDNVTLHQATKIRQLEDDKAQMREALKMKNDQISKLINRIKQLEGIMTQKDKYIQQMETLYSTQQKTVAKLQNKYDEEQRARVVNETLRQPKDKQSVAQQQYQQLAAKNNNTFVDANVKSDPFDFWVTDKPIYAQEYPGQPKRLHDLVNPNQIWVGKEANQVAPKLQYQAAKKTYNDDHSLNSWT